MESDQLLQGIPFLSGLPAEEMKALSGSLRRRRFARNEVIFHRDDPGDSLFVIVAGTVKITLRSEDGREAILTLLGPGDYFGELAVLDGEPRSADAVAVEAVETLSLPRAVFVTVLTANPQAAMNLLAAFSRSYVRRLTDTVHDAVFLDVPARLARALVQLLEQQKSDVAGDVQPVRVTQNDLGAMVGTTRESINKWLGYYERQGWLRRERGQIVVLDPGALLSQSR